MTSNLKQNSFLKKKGRKYRLIEQNDEHAGRMHKIQLFISASRVIVRLPSKKL